jgi:hypothetical protein
MVCLHGCDRLQIADCIIKASAKHPTDRIRNAAGKETRSQVGREIWAIAGKVESSDLRCRYFRGSLMQVEGLSLTLKHYMKVVDIARCRRQTHMAWQTGYENVGPGGPCKTEKVSVS